LSVALFVTAFAIRLYRISEQNLWFDEYSTFEVASAPIEQLPHLMLSVESNKPPLYFALIHYWIKGGHGEGWLRLPSAFFGALTCVVIASLGKQSFGLRGAFALGCLVAVSPFHIYYSQEARPYALWGLFTALALLFHVRFCRTPRLGFLIAYVLFAVLACYTFLYGFIAIGFAVLFAVAWRPKLLRRVQWQIVGANFLVGVLYLPWLVKVASSALLGVGFLQTHRAPPTHAAAYSFFSLGLGSSFGPTMENLRLLGTGVFTAFPVEAALLCLGGVLLAVLAWLGGDWLWKHNRNALWFALIGLLLFWGAPALFNAIRQDVPCNPRYALPAVFFLMILVLAAGFAAIGSGSWRWLLIGLFGAAQGMSIYNLFFQPQHGRDDLRAAANYVARLEPPPERLLICAGYLSNVFDYYYTGPVPVEGVVVPRNSENQEALDSLIRSLSIAKRFVLVYSRPDHGDPNRIFPGALEKRWRTREMQHWTGVVVYVFEPPREVVTPKLFRRRFQRRRCEALPSARFRDALPLPNTATYNRLSAN